MNFDLTASVTYDILGASWTCDQKVVSDRSIIKLERGGWGELIGSQEHTREGIKEETKGDGAEGGKEERKEER